MGPHWIRRGLAFHVITMHGLSGEQFVSFVGKKVGTKGEGQWEPFFLLVKTRRTNWQSSCPSAVTQKSSTIATRGYWRGSTSRCLHKQEIITAQTSYITRKIKQTNGRENVMIHKYQCIPFQGKHIKTYLTKFVLACRESKKVLDDHTNHRGASVVFLAMNLIDTWKSPKVMRTTTTYVERF